MDRNLTSEPILMSKLSIKNVDSIRLQFDTIPKMNPTQLLSEINKLLPEEKRLTLEHIEPVLQIMDENKDGLIEDIEFLDYVLYEIRMKRAAICDQLSILTHNEYYPTFQNHLDTANIQISSTKTSGFIRNIHHIDTPCIISSLKNEFGLYVTSIGKNSVGYWHLDLTLIEDGFGYISKDLPELISSSDDNQDESVHKDNAKHNEPELGFDMVCMVALQIMVCYQVGKQEFFIYDLKFTGLVCHVTDLPFPISCAVGFPDTIGVHGLCLAGVAGGILFITFHDPVQIRKSTGKKNWNYKSFLVQTGTKVIRIPCHGDAFITQIQYHHVLQKDLIVTTSLQCEDKSCSTLCVTEFMYQKHANIFEILSTVYYKSEDSLRALTIEETGNIFAGGSDKVIRVWKLSDLKQTQICHHSQFVGHTQTVIALHYHSKYKKLISMSLDVVINVWSYRLHTLLYTYSASYLMPSLNQKFKKTGSRGLPEVYPSFYFCSKTESIILGGEHLIAIPYGDVKREEEFTALTESDISLLH